VSDVNIRESFPYEVRSLGEFWIPVSDGTKLSARAWVPSRAADGAQAGASDEVLRVPAILEYIPYRHGDFTAVRDSMMHPYFAGHGYASIRVDLRGSGNSEGVLYDEYLTSELDDGEDVIRWIASQPWCDGRVGIIGISWGGFNGLQLAAREIPEIGAVVTASSTDDRYADDVHYMGGCLLTDNLSWASTMLAYNSCPPDPAFVGDRWRQMWMDRLDGIGPWLVEWLSHQRRDDYWKHGSVGEDFSRIHCPVLAVSGWADGYSNAVFRLLEGLSVPRFGLIGAWGHKYPHLADLGPAIGFLQECVRFWDRYLKGVENGYDSEPMLRAWMQDSYGPENTTSRPGRWVAEQNWPASTIAAQRFSLAPWGLVRTDDQPFDIALDTKGGVRKAETPIPDQETEEEVREFTVESPLSVGLFAGKWCSYSAETDLPTDQRLAHGGALVFETPPLSENLEILGAPRVDLVVSANQPVATIVCGLSDVAPTGAATRVTYGLLNLTHRDSHEEPSELKRGRFYRVQVRLNDTAQTFRAGHSLRLAISSTYWPLAWPPPEPVRLRVSMGRGGLELPVRPARREDRGLRPFGPPEAARPVEKQVLRPSQREWTVTHDLATNEHRMRVAKDEGRFRLVEPDLTIERNQTEVYSYRRNRYDSVKGEVTSRRAFERNGWQASATARTLLTSTRTHFRVRVDVDAFEGDTRVFSRSWNEEIPRELI
jgi:putative CocE/NonD family hydrolase